MLIQHIKVNSYNPFSSRGVGVTPIGKRWVKSFNSYNHLTTPLVLILSQPIQLANSK